MSLTSIMAEERRLMVLASLAEAGGYELNENSLRVVLRALGHVVTGDVLRADLFWLAEQGLARIEKRPGDGGDLWIVHLTGNGEDVANGAPHPGVARPRAR